MTSLDTLSSISSELNYKIVEEYIIPIIANSAKEKIPNIRLN